MAEKKPPKSSKKLPPATTAPEPATADAPKELIIVGIGASAGGLEAFENFFTALPAGSGSNMAFVLVQHLDPTHKSILTDLVKRYTKMNVFEVQDGMAVEPECAYIIPPNRDMAALHGKLHLMEPESPRGLRLPIDYFFRSLAQDQGERAICIVLAGTGTDGTLGLKAIKGEGGMVMVQAPESAKYDGMPRSAVATGLADYILPPQEMPAQLLAYVERVFGKPGVKAPAAAPPKNTDTLHKVFILLRAHTGYDFSFYKQNTIQRRIERRMAVNQIERLERYVRYLQQTPLEVETLFKELLIGVTNFFRDPEAFAVVQEKALPNLLANKAPGAAIRVWAPGCSTGEEAYSWAILLRERLDELKKEYKVQVFATDIDSEAIEKARAGIYPDSIAADVSPERLQRFFTHNQDDSHYRVSKTIRDMVVFARQNVIEDPPFSKQDIISCRNLLIYLGPELQKRVIPLFHYALNQNGYLFLGNSETIGEFVDLFAAVDRKWKLYQSKGVSAIRPAIHDFAAAPLPEQAGEILAAGRKTKRDRISIREAVEQTLLADYAPACAIVNEKGEVLYIHGRTGKYLEPPPGEASLNILRMAREGLKLELTAALRKAIAKKETVRCQNLPVKANGGAITVNLSVSPVTNPASIPGLVMVVFEDVPPVESPNIAADVSRESTNNNQRLADLERELKAKDEHLQTTIEELETSNEELKSTNEELQSTNEELQSTNEELETSKEELQSVNEELITVNMELLKKVDELSRANNDMNNLMAGTGIATVFVDHQLRIQRFTPTATQVINLIQTDVGRPVSHIVSNLAYGNLVKDIKAVLDTLIPKETEVQTTDGLWYLMRILPYRTLENVIDGAVITFVQITQQVQTQKELTRLNQNLQDVRDYAENIIATLREPLLVLDASLKVVSANRAFYHTFKVNQVDTEGRLIYELGNGQWDIPALRTLLEKILPNKRALKDFEVTHTFETIGACTMRLNAREIKQAEGQSRLILLAIEDATGKSSMLPP
jgi:two-component system CheB/CheR fusion protein